MSTELLIITGDSLLSAVASELEKSDDYAIVAVDNLSAALQRLHQKQYRFFLADLASLGEGGIPLLRRLNRMTPLTDLLILTDKDDLAGAAVDRIIPSTATVSEVVAAVSVAVQVRTLLDNAGLFGHSRNLKDAAKRIQQVAPTDISVLITGPSGTGKELVARALHSNSPRRDSEFVSINCASIPESLLESELFGHEKGAFTGADASRPGLFAQANKGTLFLDEIGEMDVNLQAKLLRAIETKSFMPLGSRKTTKVDVRIVAATNRNLQQLVQEGRFRADLYYRIGVIDIALKRLAERTEDILAIIAHYLEQAQSNVSFSSEGTDLLLRYSWPGNVRELTNFLQRLMLTAAGGEVGKETVSSLLTKHGTADKHLPVATNIAPEESGFRLIYRALLNLADEVADLKRTVNDHFSGAPRAQETRAPSNVGSGELETMEQDLIREALRRFDGNRKQTANFLGIGERTLYRKLRKYGIT
jgi:sigma-54 specific flagellar transcriptional regulator A